MHVYGLRDMVLCVYICVCFTERKIILCVLFSHLLFSINTISGRSFIYILFLLIPVYIPWFGIHTIVHLALLPLVNRDVVSSFLLLSHLLELASSSYPWATGVHALSP